MQCLKVQLRRMVMMSVFVGLLFNMVPANAENTVVVIPMGGDCKSADVLQTGQSVSYSAGDDGALQRGVSWIPATRFVDHGDRTVTDTLTGLIWLKDANCMGTNYPKEDMDSNDPAVDCSTDPVIDPGGTGECTDGKVFWKHTLDFVADINSGKFPLCNSVSPRSDWRVPNINELASLLDYGENQPAMPDGHPFSNVNSFFSWSSTTAHNVALNTEAWLVHFQIGEIRYQIKKENDHTFMIVTGGK